MDDLRYLGAAIMYLTKHPDSPISTGRDRPGLSMSHEPVEITPAMIEAGVLELAGFDSRFTSLAEAAENIIRAGLLARAG